MTSLICGDENRGITKPSLLGRALEAGVAVGQGVLVGGAGVLAVGTSGEGRVAVAVAGKVVLGKSGAMRRWQPSSTTSAPAEIIPARKARRETGRCVLIILFYPLQGSGPFITTVSALVMLAMFPAPLWT